MTGETMDKMLGFIGVGRMDDDRQGGRIVGRRGNRLTVSLNEPSEPCGY